MSKRIVAVTGHRDMLETKRVRDEISAFFDKALVNCDNLRLLSPLALGADTLVAKLFLEKKEQYPQLTLEVVLPFEQSVYEEAFDVSQRDVFLSYVSEASKVSVIPQEEGHAYENLGKYLVGHADLLLALWDGTVNDKKGGTADVVKYAQAQGCQVKHLLVQRKNS